VGAKEREVRSSPIMSMVAHSSRFSMLYEASGSLPSNLAASLAALAAASANAALQDQENCRTNKFL